VTGKFAVVVTCAFEDDILKNELINKHKNRRKNMCFKGCVLDLNQS
jgi:hypothetical protein